MKNVDVWYCDIFIIRSEGKGISLVVEEENQVERIIVRGACFIFTLDGQVVVAGFINLE